MTTRLFVDANILVRCVVGLAARHAHAAVGRGLLLATTAAQADETRSVIAREFRFSPAEADAEVTELLSLFAVYELPYYRAVEPEARARMHHKNTRDWPLLAAAMVAGGAIWTDDRDFFGVGVPLWSTRNLQFAVRTHA